MGTWGDRRCSKIPLWRENYCEPSLSASPNILWCNRHWHAAGFQGNSAMWLLRHLLIFSLWHEGFRLNSRTCTRTILMQVMRPSTTSRALTLYWKDTSSSRANECTWAWPLSPPAARSRVRNNHSKEVTSKVAVFLVCINSKDSFPVLPGSLRLETFNGLEW